MSNSISPVSGITYEPFAAAFTGALSTYVDTTGVRWRLAPPLKIQKNQRYMLAIDRKAGSCRFLPLITPRVPWEKLAR